MTICKGNPTPNPALELDKVARCPGGLVSITPGMARSLRTSQISKDIQTHYTITIFYLHTCAGWGGLAGTGKIDVTDVERTKYIGPQTAGRTLNDKINVILHLGGTPEFQVLRGQQNQGGQGGEVNRRKGQR